MPEPEFDLDAVRAFLRLLRGLHQDQVIEAAELALLETHDAVECPWPNTAHPAYAAAAKYVRAFDGDHVRVPRGSRPAMLELEPQEVAPLAQIANTLTRRRALAPAPFVKQHPADDARYAWSVWVDDAGRHVAGDAELVFRRG